MTPPAPEARIRRLRWPAVVLACASLGLAAAVVAVARDRFDPGAERQAIQILGDDCGPDQERRCEPYSVPDPLLGFTYRPGEYRISLSADGEPHPLVFRTKSDAEGWRATTADPARHLGLPELWIFGCSFTWGFSVDWDRTFPALVQTARPDLRVRNFAGVGFGNVQALLQLRQRLEERREPPPKLAVFSYAAFHPERNVASPAVLRRWGDAPGFRHPRAALDADGRLTVELVEFTDVDRPEPTLDESRRVTMAIFDELLALCRRHGITPVLAVQSLVTNVPGHDTLTLHDEPVVTHCRDAGFHVVDQVVPETRKEWNNLPWDGHPNDRAHAEYARKLLDALGQLEPLSPPRSP